MINCIKEKIIEPVENNPAGTAWWLLFFAVVILMRNFGDGLAWTHTIGHETHPSYPQFFSILKIFNAYALAHIEMYLIVCCIIYLLTKENILKISKIVIVFWIVSWIVPLWDYVTVGGYPLQYGTEFSEILPALINIFNPFYQFERHSIGQRLEALFLCIGVATYIYIKTQSILKAVSGWIMSQFSFVVLLGFLHVVTVGPIYRIFPIFSRYVPEELIGASLGDKLMGTPGLVHTNTQITGILLMVMITIFLLIWFRIYAGKKNFSVWIKNINWSKGLNYAALTVAGIVMGIWRMENVLPHAFQNPIDYFASVMLALAVFFAYLHICTVKGIINKRSDRSLKWASFGEQKLIASIFLFMAIFAAINTTYWCLLYLIVFILLFYFIMLPPLKIERIPIISDLFIALTYMFSFFTGYGLLADREAVHLLPGPLWQAALLGFTLAGILRYRKKLSRHIVPPVIFSAFMVVPLLTGLSMLYIAAGVLGLTAAFIVYRFEHKAAYVSYISILYYGVILYFIRKYVVIAL